MMINLDCSFITAWTLRELGNSTLSTLKKRIMKKVKRKQKSVRFHLMKENKSQLMRKNRRISYSFRRKEVVVCGKG